MFLKSQPLSNKRKQRKTEPVNGEEQRPDEII